MDNHDKIFDKFKEAAQNSEQKDFPGMEKIWSRVEDKLDKKEDKKTIALWKKIAVAASFLLLLSLGFQFLKSDKNPVNEIPKVVIQETEKSQKPDLNPKNETFSSDSGIVSKEEAIKILENQAKNKESVAIHQATGMGSSVQLIEPVVVSEMTPEAIAAPQKKEGLFEEDNTIVSKKETSEEMGYSSKFKEREAAKAAFADKQEQKAKKSAPLIVLNGNAMAHNDDSKRDKMMQDELPNMSPENVESLVILDEPLYIIDGIYFSENDLFGKNPTSPYAPLNKQEIKTITILQDLEATEKYGEKGRKGVVIITTKTGKPALKK
ncbi:hypothetical protein [Flavobacterium chungangense]|uniref:TonB-dependent receptor plug domain-containing protein n=1 Tax=Flavobacterium chungangense TaxID=554283 RepID=A0A6V6Z809_9FLAO|nr:hypothetical protein [Flavobacterium chungangense]CAD0007941.1 hypothetical protein FLACHUCJ7_03534 [Flavobacterium chungangense]